MFARVTTVEIFDEDRPDQPTTVDESLNLWKEKVAETKRERAGFVAGLVLMDRKTSRLRTVTLWETEEDMKSLQAEGIYQTLVNAFSDPMAKLPEIEYWEVGQYFRADWSKRGEAQTEG